MTTNLNKETWKDIPGFPGYKASDWGRIQSFKRYPSGKILKPALNPQNGYLYVLLRQGEESIHCLVHRLVALTFVPNPDPEHKKYVNHLDENKQNCFARNLSWCTNQENCQYGYLGPAKKSMSLRNYHANHEGRFRRMVAKVDPDTKQVLKIYDSVHEAAKQNHIYNHKSVNTAASKFKEGKKLKGFLWEYMSDGIQQVKAFDLSGALIKIYDGIAAAARELGISPVGISRCCNGERKTAYGMRFEFVNPL